MLDDAPVTVTLTASELGHALGAVRKHLKKRERELAKSAFVPEPGRANLNAMKIERLRGAEARLTAALDGHLGRIADQPEGRTARCPNE